MKTSEGGAADPAGPTLNSILLIHRKTKVCSFQEIYVLKNDMAFYEVFGITEVHGLYSKKLHKCSQYDKTGLTKP